MKAVRFHEHGDAGVLRVDDVPRPRPQPGELLVRVHAAGLNPIDWKTRSGTSRHASVPLPFTGGWDLSGVVEEVAEGCERFTPGDEVFGLVRFPEQGATFAEYCAVPATDAVRKPETLTHVEAAAVPLAGLTAWQALFEGAELRASQTLLVHAAAGGVGHLAVQLGKWAGARVIGTGSAASRDVVLGLGADEFVDYAEQRFDDRREYADAVLEPLGGETRERSWAVLREGGIMVALVGPRPDPAEAGRRGRRAAFVLVRRDAVQLERIARLIDEGLVEPRLERVFPLGEAAEAYRLSESGHAHGKIVLSVAR